MIKVDLWQLVGDWTEEHYKHIKVTKFKNDSMTNMYPTDHLGRIIFHQPNKTIVEIGFVAPKGVLVWPPYDEKDREIRQFEYEMYYAVDPKMFEKLDKMLRKYEPKRSK